MIGIAMAHVDIVDHNNGMVTLGLPAEAGEACRTTHERFLIAHHLDHWKLIVVQIPGTRRILVFSGATGDDEDPDYTLTDAQLLTTRIGEILAAHHEQHNRQVSPVGSS
jgi:hypothetical protein